MPPWSEAFDRVMCQAVHSHFYSDMRTKIISSKTKGQLAFLHPVHTTTEKFENGIVTLKTHHMYSVHITTEKFWNCVWKNSVREITWLSWRHRFRKTPFWKCFSSSGLKSVFVTDVSVDRRPNRRTKAVISNTGLVWMGLESSILRLKKMPKRK